VDPRVTAREVVVEVEDPTLGAMRPLAHAAGDEPRDARTHPDPQHLSWRLLKQRDEPPRCYGDSGGTVPLTWCRRKHKNVQKCAAGVAASAWRFLTRGLTPV